MKNKDTLKIDKKDVSELARPLLSAKAQSLMDTQSPTAFVRTGNTYLTAGGKLELLNLGIRTTVANLDKAIVYMAAELNILAESGLWESTLSKPATINIGLTLGDVSTIAVNCFPVIRAGEMDTVPTLIKSYYETGHLLKLEDLAPATETEPE